MSRIRNRRGFTLMEVLVAAGVTAMVAGGCLSLLIAGMKSFETTTVQSYSDSGAVIAMQNIVSDVREAKSFSILEDGHRLHVVFPVTTDDGYYNRAAEDPDNQVDYYVSDATGVPGQDGTILWRAKVDGSKRRVAGNISSVLFHGDDSQAVAHNYVEITVVSSNESYEGSATTSLTERVVYLRNY